MSKKKNNSPDERKFFLNKVAKLFKKNKNSAPVCACGQIHEPDPIPIQQQNSFKIAFVVDDLVEDIIHCNDRLGLLLLSYPKIIEVEDGQEVGIQWTYNEENNTFTRPDEVRFE